jgi:hypothetical protein
MVVGNNESMTTKNAGKLLAISIAMPMWQYNAECIAQSRSQGYTGGMVQAWVGHFVTPITPP